MGLFCFGIMSNPRIHLLNYVPNMSQLAITTYLGNTRLFDGAALTICSKRQKGGIRPKDGALGGDPLRMIHTSESFQLRHRNQIALADSPEFQLSVSWHCFYVNFVISPVLNCRFLKVLR